jgi:hypothetical protein
MSILVGNDRLLADLTSVLDHLLNESSQFLQEHLVAINELEDWRSFRTLSSNF